MRLLRASICTMIIGVWIVLLIQDARLGVDFVPLYLAGERILSGLSPYGADATADLMRQWHAPFAAAGNAYPLPMLILILPLTLLPLMAATLLWTTAGALGTGASVGLARRPATLLVLPFLFLPFHRAVVMGQATLLWMALAVGLVYAINKKHGPMVGIVCALLLLKPQNGAILALGGLVYAIREHPSALWWFAGTGTALGGVSWALQPQWVSAWLDQVRLYQAVVQPPALLPVGVLVVLACWRLPWWGLLAAAQVVCFPLTDLYSVLPLLLCWVSIGGTVALVGAGVSWLWPLLGMPNDLVTIWCVLLLPLMAGAIWRGWLAPMRDLYNAPLSLPFLRARTTKE